jgi:hypothetical protein
VFASTERAAEILEKSPMEVLAGRAPDNVVILDVEFRMPSNLYQHLWPSMRAKLGRIHYVRTENLAGA